MAQYIDKTAVVEEIEGKRDTLTHLKYIASNYNDEKTLFAVEKQIEQYESLISFLETLEVKEVNLEKEIKDYLRKQPIVARSHKTDFRLVPSPEEIAKHFFELGLKTKGEKTMKANEAPEKVYIHKSQYWGLMTNKCDTTKNGIEYTRTDAFIEKACKWLKENFTYMHPRKGTEVCVVNLSRFKDYMKGE